MSLGFLDSKPAVSADSVAFEPPDEWEDDPNRTYRFAVTDEGLYVCGGDGFFYEAVRADTTSTTVLTGTWKERDYGSGSFILVVPKDAVPQSTR